MNGDQQYGYPPPPGYGPPTAYGPPPGQAGPYGQLPPPWSPSPLSWPHGPGRPGSATAAGVLGFVTGGLTVLMSLIILFAVVGGDDEPSTVLMLLGLPCAAGLIAGAAVLMGRGSPNPLFGSALAAAAVLVLVLFVGVATLDADGRTGVSMFVVLALPLPVLTAVFARVHRTVGWAATG